MWLGQCDSMPQKASKGHEKQQKATRSHNNKSGTRRQLATTRQRVLRWLGGYWNIKKGGDTACDLGTNCFKGKLIAGGWFQPLCATNVPPVKYVDSCQDSWRLRLDDPELYEGAVAAISGQGGQPVSAPLFSARYRSCSGE